jgi:hypothetical protein
MSRREKEGNGERVAKTIEIDRQEEVASNEEAVS